MLMIEILKSETFTENIYKEKLYPSSTYRKKRSIFEPKVVKARSSFFESLEPEQYNLNNQLFVPKHKYVRNPEKYVFKIIEPQNKKNHKNEPDSKLEEQIISPVLYKENEDSLDELNTDLEDLTNLLFLKKLTKYFNNRKNRNKGLGSDDNLSYNRIRKYIRANLNSFINKNYNNDENVKRIKRRKQIQCCSKCQKEQTGKNCVIKAIHLSKPVHHRIEELEQSPEKSCSVNCKNEPSSTSKILHPQQIDILKRDITKVTTASTKPNLPNGKTTQKTQKPENKDIDSRETLIRIPYDIPLTNEEIERLLKIVPLLEPSSTCAPITQIPAYIIQPAAIAQASLITNIKSAYEQRKVTSDEYAKLLNAVLCQQKRENMNNMNINQIQIDKKRQELLSQLEEKLNNFKKSLLPLSKPCLESVTVPSVSPTKKVVKRWLFYKRKHRKKKRPYKKVFSNLENEENRRGYRTKYTNKNKYPKDFNYGIQPRRRSKYFKHHFLNHKLQNSQ